MREKAWVEVFQWCCQGCRRRWKLGRYLELLRRRRWWRRWRRWRRRGWWCGGRWWGILEPAVWRREVPRRAGKPLLQCLLESTVVDRLTHGSSCNSWWRWGRRRGRKCNSIGLWSRQRNWRWRDESRWSSRTGWAQFQHSHGRPGGWHGRWRGRWWWRRRGHISPCGNVIDVWFDGLQCRWCQSRGQNLLGCSREVKRYLASFLVLQPGDGAVFVHCESRRLI